MTVPKCFAALPLEKRRQRPIGFVKNGASQRIPLRGQSRGGDVETPLGAG